MIQWSFRVNLRGSLKFRSLSSIRRRLEERGMFRMRKMEYSKIFKIVGERGYKKRLFKIKKNS